MQEKVIEGLFIFYEKKLSRPSEIYYLKLGLYFSIRNIRETTNGFAQETHNHSESCITVKVSRRTQKVEIYLLNGGFGLAFFSTDLGQFVSSLVGNEFVVMLQRKGLQKPEFACDNVRIHSLTIYTNLTEYNIVGKTKALLLRCFLFISKLKARDIKTVLSWKKNFQLSDLSGSTVETAAQKFFS